MSQVCDKIPLPDDCPQIRDSIENSGNIEWIVDFGTYPDTVEVKVDTENSKDVIVARYESDGLIYIEKVYTEDMQIENGSHEKGETHRTISYPDSNYRISQDFDPDGKPIPGTAHITDQTTHTVVWNESDSD